jgi:hypothetical protein
MGVSLYRLVRVTLVNIPTHPTGVETLKGIIRYKSYDSLTGDVFVTGQCSVDLTGGVTGQLSADSQVVSFVPGQSEIKPVKQLGAPVIFIQLSRDGIILAEVSDSHASIFGAR